MNKQMGIVAIFVICVLVLLIGMMKQRAQVLFQFVMRIVVGAAAIYLTNQMLLANKSSIAVGMNSFSLLTVGVLGAGGYGLLYGIMIYKSL